MRVPRPPKVFIKVFIKYIKGGFAPNSVCERKIKKKKRNPSTANTGAKRCILFGNSDHLSGIIIQSFDFYNTTIFSLS